MSIAMKLLTVYVVMGKRKPVGTGQEIDPSKPLPSVLEYKGTTYYFNNADLVAGTVTYVNVPFEWR